MSMVSRKLMKQTWYPRPHELRHSWGHGLETGVVNHTTIYPIIIQDEAQGTPSAYEAHPENAAFVNTSSPNCFTDSTVDFVIAKFTVQMTKGALVTDGLDMITFGYMPIFTAFIDDLTAIDELSSSEVQDILELQSESTDRQAFPLYNAVDMPIKFTGSTTLNADVPGLT